METLSFLKEGTRWAPAVPEVFRAKVESLKKECGEGYCRGRTVRTVWGSCCAAATDSLPAVIRNFRNIWTTKKKRRKPIPTGGRYV